MSRIGEYTFLLTDLLTMEVKSVVELSSFYSDDVYNMPGAALGTARFDHPTTTKFNFKDWSTGIYAVQNGVIKYGGIVGKVQRRGGTRVISVPVVGFFEYFRNRILRSAVGMNHGQLVRTSDIEWKDVEQFEIFNDYILHAQHPDFIDGNLGALVEWDTPSGKLRTSIRQQSTAKFIGVALTTLANALDGFDFYTTYYFDSQDRPRFKFKLRYPHRGFEIPHTLLFQPERVVDKTKTTLRALELDGTAGGYAHCGDATSITGDIDIIVHYEGDDWTPTTIKTLRSKWGAAGNRSYKFSLNTDGKLRFEWSEDGTAIQTVNADFVTGFSDGIEGTVRVTMDVDDGGDFRVTLYKSENGGQSWTSLTADPYESPHTVRY